MPRTKEAFEAIKLERKRDILNTSIRLFIESGYEKVSVDLITQSANCSHGLFYHYFKNKDEVLEAIQIENSYFPIEKLKVFSSFQKIHSILLSWVDLLSCGDINEIYMFRLSCIEQIKSDYLENSKCLIRSKLERQLEKLIRDAQHENEMIDGDVTSLCSLILHIFDSYSLNLIKKTPNLEKPDVDLLMHLLEKKNVFIV